jgi:hypothetical protein
MHSSAEWGELGLQENRERRRESRFPIRVPIQVTGFGRDGRFFIEETRTVDVSESGCSFTLKRAVERGGILAIKVRAGEGENVKSPLSKPLLYQVARAVDEENGWIIGAAKLQPESIWNVAFPHAREPKQRVS